MQRDEEPCAPSQRFWDLYTPKPPAVVSQPVKVPKTSISRLELSSAPLLPPTSASQEEPGTVLYLAYGSNLSAETFKGKRGIKPLSAVNVHVPAIDLTFDLCGIPYAEPCFANCQYRKNQSGSPRSKDYHKTRWHKGLVGVVYEVTLDDYRTIIATEGGGTSYKDELVQCYVLPDGSKTVDPDPSGTPFQAHTLLCPFDSKDPNRIWRQDPNYAQPSARYLKLITDGAEEHGLPEEYINYLHGIRAYTATTLRQKMAQLLIVSSLLPFLLMVMGLSKVVADENGKIPAWLANIMAAIFRYVWIAYDRVLRNIFGDGERTIGGKALTDIEEIDLEKRWDEKKMAGSGEIKESM
ncbi:045cc455-06c1-4058-a992-0e6fecada661-CDS [Sclerotinia trifoliorum]|uniref:gamma-glutamylcyclotransferase n=1 Tax=Sclerotinia trifoliorum TaxID=28548 RepID=A0A8H2ZQW2_9HELO|nr:045cc455-06c1-4058-a992-0e6fecada661-CDS [Sclerotinia trifoliorum]